MWLYSLFMCCVCASAFYISANVLFSVRRMPTLPCWRPAACPSILGLKKKSGVGGEKRENQITFSEWLCKASEALRRARFAQNRSAGDAPLPRPLSLVMKRERTPMRIISRSFSGSRRHRQGINNHKANFVMFFFFSGQSISVWEGGKCECLL